MTDIDKLLGEFDVTEAELAEILSRPKVIDALKRFLAEVLPEIRPILDRSIDVLAGAAAGASGPAGALVGPLVSILAKRILDSLQKDKK